MEKYFNIFLFFKLTLY